MWGEGVLVWGGECASVGEGVLVWGGGCASVGWRVC